MTAAASSAGPWWQTAVFLAGTLALCAITHTLEPGAAAQALLLAPAVAILGLPHGALDWPLARGLWQLEGAGGQARFSLLYLGLAAAVLSVWLVLPGPALLLFVCYSALHFSRDWAGAPRLWQWSGGLATVGAPALTHGAEVDAIFTVLATDAAAQTATTLLAGAGLAGLAALLIACFRDRAPQALAEQIGIWGAALVLPPLVYFIAYFCLLHSVRHLTGTLRTLPDRGAVLGQAALVTGMTVAMAAVAFLALPTETLRDAALLQVVFIGLASLTVPHMLLVEMWERRAAT